MTSIRVSLNGGVKDTLDTLLYFTSPYLRLGKLHKMARTSASFRHAITSISKQKKQRMILRHEIRVKCSTEMKEGRQPLRTIFIPPHHLLLLLPRSHPSIHPSIHPSLPSHSRFTRAPFPFHPSALRRRSPLHAFPDVMAGARPPPTYLGTFTHAQACRPPIIAPNHNGAITSRTCYVVFSKERFSLPFSSRSFFLGGVVGARLRVGWMGFACLMPACAT